MERRKFLKRTGAAAGLATLAVPALAQSAPAVKWRMSSIYPKSLDNLHGSAEALCKRVAELTDGKFEIRVFAGGEIVPAAQNMDAVSNGTVECNFGLASSFFGKNSALGFDAGMPFGLNARQHHAWMFAGGGMQLMREIYKKYNIVNFVAGNVGVQMGGWYRKPIKSLADLNGLKMRVAGLGGLVMSKLGVVPQQIPAADIYPALEKGTIDAAEWIGPYDDIRLGLNKVCPYYYAPGWWEGSAAVTIMTNSAAWNALPPMYKAAFECACNEQVTQMLASYDGKNPEALKKLIGQGTKVAYFPKAVMDASFKASTEVLNELAGKNPDFKTVYDQWAKFRRDQFSWFRVAELELDNFTATALSKG